MNLMNKQRKKDIQNHLFIGAIDLFYLYQPALELIHFEGVSNSNINIIDYLIIFFKVIHSLDVSVHLSLLRVHHVPYRKGYNFLFVQNFCIHSSAFYFRCFSLDFIRVITIPSSEIIQIYSFQCCRQKSQIVYG